MKKILVFRIGHLGDTLVSLPAFWRIRDSFPDAHITLLTNFDPDDPRLLSPKDVLPESGLFDALMSYPPAERVLTSGPEIIRFLFRLRRQRFDAVFYLPPRSRTAVQAVRDIRFFKLAGIRKVFGDRTLEARRLPIQSPPEASAVISESEYLLECVSEGIPELSRESKSELLITETERKAAFEWLASSVDLAENDLRLIAVAPGSKWESKIWNEKRYSEVVARLMERVNAFPVVFGGEEDREKGERLIAKWGRGANACGKLTVRQSAALIERCALYLGNDTGTMHLAAAVGTRCVAVFAAIDLEGRWYPIGEGHRIFRSTVECQHCHTPDCFNFNKCLELIEVSAVLEACESIMSGATKAPASPVPEA
ncbi:MAG TPA: glycosyltransferase family 9 protein [Pyrinomonadaceae bacterium]|nr:glycosyltransferase family 9 protein [Pyrinomonadaceae bacterium]HMP64926.1 glycosyltransferase family 9 protein [Pyrinomonadaceae bacterium]